MSPMISAPAPLPRILTGEHLITADCPECHRTVALRGTISVVLTVTDDGGGSLRAKLATKAVGHDCADKQPSLFGAMDASDALAASVAFETDND